MSWARRRSEQAERLMGRASCRLTVALVKRKITKATLGEVISSLEQALAILKEVRDGHARGE